jgi:hypothetical protein
MKNTVKLRTGIPVHGFLSIFKRYKDGTTDLAFAEHNILTLARRQFLLSGIYTTAVVSDPVNRLRVGIGGTVDPEGLFPRPEDPTWTNLNNNILTVSTTHTEDLTVPNTTFIADIDESQCNGQSINEAGLITVAGLLFNVKTFPSIPKTSDFSLHFEWVIEIA